MECLTDTGMKQLNSDSPTDEVLAESLRQYLQTHPRAADTLEGIAKWWLPQALQPKSLEEVEKALDDLVVQGVVKKTTTAAGMTIYSSAQNP